MASNGYMHYFCLFKLVYKLVLFGGWGGSPCDMFTYIVKKSICHISHYRNNLCYFF